MIPTYQTLMRPVLASAENGERKISDVVAQMEDAFELSEDERAELLPSGKQTVIANRTHWARSYLKQAGLVRDTRRGWFELTDRRREVLADPSIELNAKYLERFEEFQDFRARSSQTDDGGAVVPPDDTTRTPDEDLQAAHARLNKALAAALIDQVRVGTPAFFEQLIVDLLLAVGYGGTSKDAGRALGQTGDNGVDRVIDEDPLGVDQIYIQAKRYGAQNTVGAGDIRDFFGALSLKKATKGIFVTTSTFSASAVQTARDLGARIVLIDGAQLARLMIRYNIGCREEDVLRIKGVDETCFEA